MYVYISLNSTLQCNLIEGPFIYKVTGAPWDLWRSSQKHLSIGGGRGGRNKTFES